MHVVSVEGSRIRGGGGLVTGGVRQDWFMYEYVRTSNLKRTSIDQ
jgi:hypothetical protein